MYSEVSVSFPGSLRHCAAVRSGAPAWTALFFLCVIAPQATRATLIWEINIGNPLPGVFLPSASDGLQSVNLGAQYAFPFEGTKITSINVATSGLIWLNTSANTSQCCILGNSSAALTAFEQGPARIIPGWAALQPGPAGPVDFNQISDANGTRTVLTYYQVPTSLTTNVTFQLQLFTTGEIIFSYLQFGGTSLGPNPATVLGLTGGGDFSPNMFDFTALQPGVPATLTGASIYDYLPTSGLNLSGDSFILTPTPLGTPAGWVITAAGTPEPATFIPAGIILLLFAFISTRRIRITK
jgi:hypothetical protein